MKLVTADQMREIDRRSIEERGIPGIRLMEQAGRAIAMDVAEAFPPGRIAILCGHGNNGGDGYIAARHLQRFGWDVTLIAVTPPEKLKGNAREAFEQLPPDIMPISWGNHANMAEILAQQDVVVDALLGTGAKGPPRSPFDEVITTLNEAQLPVFSADIPSGLDPDNGRGDLVVKAFRTITMGLPKWGLVRGVGPDMAGYVRVESLSFPPDLLTARDSLLETLTQSEAADLLPQRPPGGHKGTFGMVAIAAGSAAMPGAAILAGEGAVRSGTGLVRMIVPDSVRPFVTAALPETLLTRESPGGDQLEFADAMNWERVKALVIGPGMEVTTETRRFLADLLETCETPVVLDADALNILAANPEILNPGEDKTVLTPHPGELARLLNVKVSEIEEDRWSAVARASEKFRAVVVLKGRGTLVAHPDGWITHIGAGNTALSRGGSGDVLAGLIGGLLAQGIPPWNAARLGAFLHGMAADRLLREGNSPRGVRLADMMGQIPFAFKELESSLLANQFNG
ncbi:MAG: NAD(P)H-hydrate dehydratase [Candidatus Sumerlaeia bacterium]|nr:NAD(P)H-hydrate dehydratase [Candidatus Sumerlaeia bacterium]